MDVGASSPGFVPSSPGDLFKPPKFGWIPLKFLMNIIKGGSI